MLIFFVISSCEKEEFAPAANDFENIHSTKGVINTPPFLFEIKKIPTAQLLAKSENFQNLNKLLTNHLNKSNDYNRIKMLSSKSTTAISKEQQILLRLGYESEQEFITFISEIQHINNLVAQEFDYTNLTEEEKESMVIAAFETISIEVDYWDDGDGGGDSCYQTYTFCHQEAISEFKMDTFFCALGGIAIGSIATPTIGIGAGVYCYDYARDKFNAKVNLCYNDYIQCIK